VVASKYPNLCILKKYKTFIYLSYISFKSPLVQIYTSASECKSVRNIPGGHFVKAFAALASHSELCHQRHKSAVLSMLILVEGTGKNQLQPCQEL